MARPAAAFLFSVDLEDVRTMIPDGDRYAERVPATVQRYLEFLARHDVRCTFFTVGNIARRYPELIRALAAAGHEVGCHSCEHANLDRHDRRTFRDDLRRSMEDLAAAGAGEVRGFRAPMMSLTAETAWAYEVLAELGFTYSSSVLPARSPLYGWPEFPPTCVRTSPGIWEIPLSVSGLWGLKLPFASGVYFRVLPFAVIRQLFQRRLAAGRPVVGYLHPYDIDTDQEHFMHPELNGSRVYNWLMYYNRRRVFERIERLLDRAAVVVPYREYVEQRLQNGAAAAVWTVAG
jgi:peptidoglycan-N-acetylglucosamine deacetylase